MKSGRYNEPVERRKNRLLTRAAHNRYTGSVVHK